MRLRDIETILAVNLPGIVPAREEVRLPNGQPGLQLSNLETLREALTELAKVPGFEGTVAAVLGNKYVSTHLEHVQGPNQEIQPLIGQILAIQARGSQLLESIGKVLPRQNQHAISVLIPPQASLKETGALIERIARVLERVGANQPIGVAVQSFDSGSFWIEVLGSDPATFAERTMVLAYVAIKVTEWLFQKLHQLNEMRALAIVADDMAAAAQLNAAVRGKIREMLEAKKKFSPEELNKLARVGESLTKLIRAGVQLFPAANAPKSFPKLPQYPSPALPDVAKYFLPSKTDDAEEDEVDGDGDEASANGEAVADTAEDQDVKTSVG